MRPAISQTPGKVIRAALMILFFGTIVLGALSFVIYFKKEETKVARSIRYAAGLRHELDLPSLQRHEQILLNALAKPGSEATKTIASYLESTIGPENMGYNIRVVPDKATNETLAIEAELTGTRRPQEVVLVLGEFAPQLPVLDAGFIARPLASLLGVAHAHTGLPSLRTLRFVTIRNLNALKTWYLEGVSGHDRIGHVLLVGTLQSASDADVLGILHTAERGTIVLRPASTPDLLQSARALEQSAMSFADRP